LSLLQQRFALWRKERRKGARIPEALWKSAVASAVDFGVSKTASVLKLDYYGLKKRMERQRGRVPQSGSAAAFVEVPNPVAGLAKECVIEFDNGRGSCMRVHLKGTDVPDVLALGRSFWKGE
jgi:hypothetical protein